MQPDGSKVVHPDWLKWKADKDAAALAAQQLAAQQQRDVTGEEEKK